MAGKELIIRLTQSSWAGAGTEPDKNIELGYPELGSVPQPILF